MALSPWANFVKLRRCANGVDVTKVSLAVAILLALAMPASAQSGAQSGANEMLSGCKGLIGDKTPPLREVLRQGRCAGYVAGLLYARSVFLCVPEGRRRSRGYASSSSILRRDQRGCTSLLVSSPSKR